MAIQSSLGLRPTMATTGVPIGTQFFFPIEAPIPMGYFLCNGDTFSGTEYPDLADVLGSTTLPTYDVADQKVIIKARDVQIGQIVDAQMLNGYVASDFALDINVPTKTGDGATGTWDIDISGNAATATAATTATTATNVSGGSVSATTGSFSSAVTLSADPTQPMQVTTKKYVDNQSVLNAIIFGGA